MYGFVKVLKVSVYVIGYYYLEKFYLIFIIFFCSSDVCIWNIVIGVIDVICN